MAHSANAGNDTKIAGKGIGPYNLIETTFSDTSGYYGFNIHTAAHEYIHTFGVPDYYRQNYISETRDTPVGLWDPMGVPGGRPMPLAVTREAIGWTTVDEIQPQNGVYTLYEASAAYADKTKKQAVKVKPPFSPTEYFVIEYRKKGERYKFDTLDQTAPADGIIVYRVNPVYKDEAIFAATTISMYTVRTIRVLPHQREKSEKRRSGFRYILLRDRKSEVLI